MTNWGRAPTTVTTVGRRDEGWAVTGAGFFWPVFPIFGWGIGLVAHWWTVYGIDDVRREAEVQKEIRRLRGDRD